MPFRLHVVEDVFDLAVGADHERRPRDAFYFLAVHIFFFYYPEQIRDFLLWIGQQREGQTKLFLKFLLRSRRIFRDPQQHHAGLLDRRIAVAKAARFFGATRRVGFGIEIKHHGLAAKVFRGNLFAVLVRRTEVWGFIIDFHMEFSPRQSLSHRMLYRNGRFAVILATLIGFASSMLAAQGTTTQYGHKPASDKGPRALGLVQLLPNGKKGRLIPIAIMMDGKFYDAGSYKAAPV